VAESRDRPNAASDAALAEALADMPLFPLPNVVLFPHTLLPLHIFEERYRAMARDVLAGARYMAMGLIAPGEDPEGQRPAVERIAGVGEVVLAYELPDGRFNLVLRGRARVRIDRELPADRPYRRVAATLLPDLPGADAEELADAHQSLRALIGHLADAIPDGGEALREVAATHESPSELVDAVAAALIADTPLRQRLLETRDVGKRIERVAAEVVAMTARITTGGRVN
jgi:Lon protease-like protein